MKAYSLSIEQLLAQLRTDTTHGLSAKEARGRLEHYGANQLPQKKTLSAWHILLGQLVNPLVFILVFAVIASIVIKRWEDVFVISFAIAVNTVVGFLQEWKAEKAAAELQRYDIHHCIVMRDGVLEERDARTLVPGDVVHLQPGSRVPADIRLTTSLELRVDESILYGESRPVKKTTETLSATTTLAKRANMVYYGTYVIDGKGVGVVVHTGKNTVFGTIAYMAEDQNSQVTPIQKQVRQLTNFLIKVMLGALILVLLLGYISGLDYRSLISTAIALSVAALPEGLLLGITVILAIGMQRMARRKALVKKLVAAETLGAVSVVCTDKTGTLTRGYPSVARVVTHTHDMEPKETVPDDVMQLFTLLTLNNDAHIDQKNKKRVGTPLELAIIEAAKTAGLNEDQLQKQFPRVDEIAFSSERKYMVTVHTTPHGKRLIMKGAHTVVMEHCALSKDENARFTEQASAMAASGMQVIAVAYQEGKTFDVKQPVKDLSFVGLVGFIDMLRHETVATVQRLKDAGITIVLVTGDQLSTALSIAKQAHILVDEDAVLTGEQLDGLSDIQLFRAVPHIAVYASVDPQHKVRIIRAWQARRQVVAMTGDGVNDVLSIRAADIGIALSSGADVTKDIADMVLLDNNLASLVAGVQQGRILFENIRKIIVALLVDSFGEIILLVGAMLIGLPVPISSVQILWINLIADGFPNLALAFEPGEGDIMHEKPRPYDEPVLNKQMRYIIFFVAVVANLFWLIIYALFHASSYDPKHFQTSMFMFLSFSSLPLVFSARSFRKSLFQMNFWDNHTMLAIIAVELVVQTAVVYIPFFRSLLGLVVPTLSDWCIIITFTWAELVALEIMKWFLYGRERLDNQATTK